MLQRIANQVLQQLINQTAIPLTLYRPVNRQYGLAVRLTGTGFGQGRVAGLAQIQLHRFNRELAAQTAAYKCQ